MPDFTLQCSVCQTRKNWQVSDEQTQVLKDKGACLFFCSICSREIYWIYPSLDRRPGLDRRVFTTGSTAPPPTAEQQSAAALKQEQQRGARRVSLEVPVRVIAMGLVRTEDVTITTNVSRGGICFLSEKPFQVGQDVRVAMHYSPATAANVLEQRGKIVRVDIVPGNWKKGFAVKYL